MSIKRGLRSVVFNLLGFIVTFFLLGLIVVIAFLDTLYGAMIYLPNKFWRAWRPTPDNPPDDRVM
jgi:hypothetical protein